LSGLRASILILLSLLALLPAIPSQPVALSGVACFDQGRAVLYNGTVLRLPSLEKLADVGSPYGPLDGCDIRGENLAVWRAGSVTVYRGLEPVFTVRGGRAFVGSRFLLVVGHDFVAAYSLYGFEVLRLDRHTSPMCVWVLGSGRAGGKAVVLASPCTCRVRMQVESYLLVYDLDTGLYDVYSTGAVSFIPLASGVLWAKNGTLYLNGNEVGKAPDKLYPVYGLDGYATAEGGVVLIVALNGSAWRLKAPAGRGLAVSALGEGFVACSDYECTCTFNCTGFSAIAYQAFAPPTVTETPTYYLLYARLTLYLLEKPKPTTPQNSTQPNNQVPTSSTQPSNQAPTNATAPQNNTPTTQPPINTTMPQNSSMPQNSTPPSNTPTSNTSNTQQNIAQPQPQSPKQNSDQNSTILLAIPPILVTALALAGYLLHKRRYRYIS